jgi:hypothetical protein
MAGSGMDLRGYHNALVVQIGDPPATRRGRGRTKAIAGPEGVYVIPLSALALFKLAPLSVGDDKQLKAFFAAHTKPVVVGALADTLHVFDGAN